MLNWPDLICANANEAMSIFSQLSFRDRDGHGASPKWMRRECTLAKCIWHMYQVVTIEDGQWVLGHAHALWDLITCCATHRYDIAASPYMIYILILAIDCYIHSTTFTWLVLYGRWLHKKNTRKLPQVKYHIHVALNTNLVAWHNCEGTSIQIMKVTSHHFKLAILHWSNDL